MKRACLLATLLISLQAAAGEFFERDGAALRGYDPVAYFREMRPVKGSAEHTAQYKGSTFHFSSRANRDDFAASPEKFAPQYGGFCAYGTAGGYKAATDPAQFSVIDGKLYLNYNRDVQAKWKSDLPGYIAKADQKWPDVSRTTKVIE
jgi:YHS domain-containing protein